MSKVLVIISHTEHYLNDEHRIVGWGSTVREVDEMATLFDKVIHVACLYKGKSPAGLSLYSNNRVEFIPLPPYGGIGIRKLTILYTAPLIIWKVFSQLRKATHFQFRAPTSMGIYMIPLLSYLTTKKGWFKYAGNWKQENPPLSYRWQRYFLTHFQSRKVTINGKWPDQPSHCLTFENPCLTDSDLEEGKLALQKKKHQPPFKFCFVGRLDESKGLDVLLESLKLLEGNSNVDEVFVIGDGNQRKLFEQNAKDLLVKVHFLGFLQRDELFDILKFSHFIILPSKSEGFPKVIAEGWNFGCLPIVTDVSAIGQYVYHEKNGFIFHYQNRNASFLSQLIERIILTKELDKIAIEGQRLVRKFTFTAYLKHLQEEVIF